MSMAARRGSVCAKALGLMTKAGWSVRSDGSREHLKAAGFGKTRLDRDCLWIAQPLFEVECRAARRIQLKGEDLTSCEWVNTQDA